MSNESSDAQTKRPATERAEVMLEHLGERLGPLAADVGHRLRPVTSDLGRQVRVLVARAREEAEDIWAEAQNMRHHDAP